MIEKLKWGLVVVVSMALGAGVIVGIDAIDGDDGPGSSTTVIERVSPPDTSGVSTTLDSVADLVEQIRPSVVRINSTSSGSLGGVGSGIVLDKEGHILTNNHVVSGATALSRLALGRHRGRCGARGPRHRQRPGRDQGKHSGRQAGSREARRF